MVVISSTTNEWPQLLEANPYAELSQAIHEKSSLMSPTSGFLMEKASTNNQEQPHPSQLHGLRCPRCDSSNTKFCYYNNYSLSQPRHFCKACKRYWTRGGTLRNVPVGGGCRKNKRVKKHPSSSSSPEAANRNTNTASTNTTTANANPSFSNPTTNTVSSGPSNLNPLFFGFDYLPPQLNSLGVGFSSTPPTSTSYGVYGDGFSSINSLLVPPSYCSPTMATLLASSFNHQKFQTLPGQPLDNGSGNFLKEVKMDWSMSYHLEEHQLGFSSDPNPLYWNSTNSSIPSTNPVSSWHDPANLEGPSVSSLI